MTDDELSEFAKKHPEKVARLLDELQRVEIARERFGIDDEVQIKDDAEFVADLEHLERLEKKYGVKFYLWNEARAEIMRHLGVV